MTERNVLYLLPGLLCDETVWVHQIAAFRDAYDVRVPDFTRSDSLVAMARAVLDEAPARFAVAGHSMGARVALEIFRLDPARVERIALLDTGVHPKVEGEWEKRKRLLDVSATEGMGALARQWLPPMVGPRCLDDAAFMQGLQAMVERKTPTIHASQIKALVDRPDATPLLPMIRCPTLVAVGRHDGWSPPARHEEIAAAIPGARYVVFEDSGHMAPLEAPEAVTAALRDWLAMPRS